MLQSQITTHKTTLGFSSRDCWDKENIYWFIQEDPEFLECSFQIDSKEPGIVAHSKTRETATRG